MSSQVFFNIPFVCPHCGTANAANAGNMWVSGIGDDYGDEQVFIGGEVTIDDADMEDAFFVLRHPSPADPAVIAIEAWSCASCKAIRWVRLELTRLANSRYRLTSARMVPLSRATLEEAHLMSKELYAWTPQPGDDAAQVEAIRRRFLS